MSQSRYVPPHEKKNLSNAQYTPTQPRSDVPYQRNGQNGRNGQSSQNWNGTNQSGRGYNQQHSNVREIPKSTDDDDRNVSLLYSQTITIDGFRNMKRLVGKFTEFKTLLSETKKLQTEVAKSEYTNKTQITEFEKKHKREFNGNVQMFCKHVCNLGISKDLVNIANNLTELKSKINQINELIIKINEIKPQIQSPFMLVTAHTELGFILIEDNKNGWNIYDEITDYQIRFHNDAVTVYSKRKFLNTMDKYFDVTTVNVDKNKNAFETKKEFILQVANIIIKNNNIALSKNQKTSQNDSDDEDNFNDDYDDDVDDDYVVHSYKKK